MRKISDLGAIDQRVLGALLEKEQTTPEYYPLTVNSLIAACNQKSNRLPVTSLTETEIVEALDAMRGDTLVWRSDSSRAEKWSQSISRRLELDPGEKAILTLLLLRGPQTPGELRSRSGRMHGFNDIGEVDAALHRMQEEERELVVELARAPGQKETRWAHQLGELVEVVAPPPAAVVMATQTPPAPAGPSVSDDRIRELEERVESLEATVASLRDTLEPLLS